jgi:hypothetical protein
VRDKAVKEAGTAEGKVGAQQRRRRKQGCPALPEPQLKKVLGRVQ